MHLGSSPVATEEGARPKEGRSRVYFCQLPPGVASASSSSGRPSGPTPISLARADWGRERHNRSAMLLFGRCSVSPALDCLPRLHFRSMLAFGGGPGCAGPQLRLEAARRAVAYRRCLRSVRPSCTTDHLLAVLVGMHLLTVPDAILVLLAFIGLRPKVRLARTS